MEQKEIAYFNNLLLDNIEVPIDITLVSTPKEVSTPSLLHNSPSENLGNTKTSSSNKPHIAKIENYIDQKFDQAALKHLKFQILTEIKNDLNNKNTSIIKNGIQSPQNSDYDLIRELRSHIQTLQSEVHFLREELKEKPVLLRLLIITSHNQRNKSSEKTPENPVSNFTSKENSNFIEEHVPPVKDDVTDLCIDDTATKSDNTEKEKQFEKKKESSTEREEHGITTEEKSEIVIPQPVFIYYHTHIPTGLETTHHGQTHPKSNHPNSQKNGEKVPL